MTEEQEFEYAVSCILKTAKNGVHREDLIWSGFAPIKVLKKAIAEAKRQGMYSVRDMGRGPRGTYYQYDGEINNNQLLSK